ncbi:hypothetical protein [Inmirania thermothiophila]|uniref:Uncharacterized protein n=1 Tax=Inmirania thermothiophila TaxID=1750597 RepID=A0A3N1Y1W2_9GAMM|nr:hypothetical protein [Inmirania thermothiophila]ROR32511.1 hypothetical protein EDC57_1713 [Inmirania thermothiophila]
MHPESPPGPPAPRRCFCEIPLARLLRWVRLREAGYGTVELLRRARDAAEREEIAVVALLDVADEVLVREMAATGRDAAHLLACREALRRRLAGAD